MATRVRAVRDDALFARIVSRRPLLYSSGPDLREDRPHHVRAGSGLVRLGADFAIVQDDADFVALIDAASGAVRSVALPPRIDGVRQFDDERGNKAQKLDFEACLVAKVGGVDTLVAFGSGSTPARESILVLPVNGAPRVVPAPSLYAGLRAEPEFSGSELNVEGAVLVGDAVRLFQRGNGAVRAGVLPVNATCDVPWSFVAALLDGRETQPPPIGGIAQFDLGGVSSVPFTFTDAATSGPGSVAYVAAAEGSPDAVRDGVVVGAAIGTIRAIPGDRFEARYALLFDERDEPAHEKAEGIALGDASSPAHVVLDVDDPSRPSELCVVELTGPW
jgi:hypothetical protein